MSVHIPTSEAVRLLLVQAREQVVAPEIIKRLEWISMYLETDNVSDVCETYGIARTTFYRWLYRFDPENLQSLADQPNHPIVPRAPSCPVKLTPKKAVRTEEPMNIPHQPPSYHLYVIPALLGLLLLNVLMWGAFIAHELYEDNSRYNAQLTNVLDQ